MEAAGYRLAWKRPLAKNARKTGGFPNEDDRIGQDFGVTFVVTRAKSAGNSCSKVRDFWEKGVYFSYSLAAPFGYRVLRLDDGQPLTYGKPGFENPYFVAEGSR